jgi:hypothetical protein
MNSTIKRVAVVGTALGIAAAAVAVGSVELGRTHTAPRIHVADTGWGSTPLLPVLGHTAA